MKKSPLWQHGLIVLLVLGVAVFGKTDNASVPATETPTHQNMACVECHGMVASLDETVTAPPPDQHCRLCHADAGEAGDRLSVVFHRDKSRSCSDCHLFHETNMINAAGNVFAPAQSGGPGSCEACHDGNEEAAFTSEGHQLAARLYHSNFPEMIGLNASETCLLCHAEEQSEPIASLDPMAIPRFTRHVMHPIGPIKVAGGITGGGRIREVIDPRLRIFNGRIECHTCHQLSSATKNRLVDLGSPEALCLGCHEFD
jgi:predicted CXXCH cytochrome family protein